MSQVFVLGAGFSAHQGYPLVRDLRTKLKDFLGGYGSCGDARLDAIRPQYERFCASVDPHGRLQFEELFMRLSALGREDARYQVLATDVSHYLWHLHPSKSSLQPAYKNFVYWVEPEFGRSNGTVVVSFNWDLVLEQAIDSDCRQFSYGPSPNWIPVLKPHGSINWNRYRQKNIRPPADNPWCEIFGSAQISYDRLRPFRNPYSQDINTDLIYMIWPSETEVRDEDAKKIWEHVKEALSEADEVIFIGYSLPSYDKFALDVLQNSICNHDCSVEVITPSQETWDAYRHSFGDQCRPFQPARFEESRFARACYNANES